MKNANSGKPKLLDRFREALRARHYSRRTERTYSYRVKRYIDFHNVRHPAEEDKEKVLMRIRIKRHNKNRE